MVCPMCGNEKFRVDNTKRIGNVTLRYLTCVDGRNTTGCGTQVRSHEEIVDVSVYNYKRNRALWVDIEDFKTDHREKLQEGYNSFNPRLFK